MWLLELFAGSRSIGKTAESLGMDVFSSDINDFPNINYVTDIINFDTNKVPFKPDIIWASPPCTTFSVASIGTHWDGGNRAYIPKTKEAKYGIEMVSKTIEIINYFNPKYWFIENPRGLLRKMPIMKQFDRATICYCRYGDNRMKPTDIWTNHLATIYNNSGWKPLPMCFNENKHCNHERAPRGSKTGTQGLSNNFERSKIPSALCNEILKSCL